MLQLVRYRRWASQLHRKCTRKLLLTSYSTTTATADGGGGGHGDSKPGPPPIQVLLTESAGRGVFATRRIGSGELIHTAKPVVSHPSLSSLHKVCHFCLKSLVGKATVSPAQTVAFCSEECSKQAKGYYEVEKCANWSAFDDHCRTQGLKYPLLVKRFACMVISGVASADSLDILQPALLSPEMMVQMQEEFVLLRGALEDTDITDEQIAYLFASAAASVEAEAAVGNAVYMLPSFYNHDCDPNAHILWIENVDARLKALRDIEAGEELRICYIDASMGRDARQAILSKGFGFQCRCHRCLSNE